MLDRLITFAEDQTEPPRKRGIGTIPAVYS
jgi:hypothetical protein